MIRWRQTLARQNVIRPHTDDGLSPLRILETTLQKQISIHPLTLDSPALTIAARWRYDTWLKDDGYSLQDSIEQLQAVARGDRPREAGFIASFGSQPAGICLMVEEELNPLHDVSPWLASLFVVPEFRRGGVATRLIAAIEDHARIQGVEKLYLYTVDAEALYLKCGWQVVDRVLEHGNPLALLVEHLHDLPAACTENSSPA